MQAISELNIYDILEPCYHGTNVKNNTSQSSKLPQSFKDLGVTNKTLPVRTRMLGRAWPLRAPVRDGRVPSWQELAAGVPAGVPCMVSTNMLSFLQLMSFLQNHCYWIPTALGGKQRRGSCTELWGTEDMSFVVCL